MTTNRSSSRARAGARNEVLTMLKDDHKQVKKAFRAFEKLDAHANEDECRALVERTCEQLEVHTTLEEEIFYPSVREKISEEDLIDEAEVEHTSAKSLIAQLKELAPGDARYAATFTVLGEYVKHHIKEEESELFPQLERVRVDWEDLSGRMHERREALMAEHMPQEAASAKESNTERARPAAS